ncbi:MAG: type II toxin-antitoxin system PemK/MazF family toxin [Rectinema subterraneum]|uniref:type II toxin-antitoxin system PemK/MazF family toxin n=1 Tax=Rectinema subterraneum TaxID=2653714 RepID=UPI003C7C13BF
MMRGELWWADFGLPFGGEPGFRRPVVILQDDAFNASNIRTTIIIPLTTNLALAEAPGNVILPKEESNLSKDSVLVVSQLSAVDKQRLIERIGTLKRQTLEEVEEGIKLILNLT